MSKKGQDGFAGACGFLTGGFVSLVARLILGGVFLVAGVLKALDPGGLASSIRSYELGLPEWFVTLSAHGLPYLEILLGLYLVAGLFTKVSAWVTSGLVVLFIFALLQGALRGLEIDCGCFGPSAGTSNLWLDALRDIGLLALGLLIAFAPTGRFSIDALIRKDRS